MCVMGHVKFITNTIISELSEDILPVGTDTPYYVIERTII